MRFARMNVIDKRQENILQAKKYAKTTLNRRLIIIQLLSYRTVVVLHESISRYHVSIV